jgi:hypothetical protein
MNSGRWVEPSERFDCNRLYRGCTRSTVIQDQVDDSEYRPHRIAQRGLSRA